MIKELWEKRHEGEDGGRELWFEAGSFSITWVQSRIGNLIHIFKENMAMKMKVLPGIIALGASADYRPGNRVMPTART